jgi:GntR family transcriptional regulator / MocR family aminotransferase
MTDLPQIHLDSESKVSLHRQLYNTLRHAILSGALPLGTKLPPTRALASAHGISRNTVLAAFEDLIAEGFLESKAGSGTFVAHISTPKQQIAAQELSNRGLTLSGIAVGIPRENRIAAFRHGIPDFNLFPWEIWTRLYSQVARSQPNLGYADPIGEPALRSAIAAQVAATRAVRCTPEQIIITSGSQQAIFLAAQLLLEPNDLVWFENPGYLGARAALLSAQAQIKAIPVDEHGLDVRAGQKIAPSTRLAYVTPSHQYPTGVTMSHTRRLELLNWANQTNAWILEDDYDSEYRYDHRPLESLQSLDSHGRVIYIGTFSKVLFPALRLGYLIVPSNLSAAFAAARAIQDRGSSTLEQQTLTAFMQQHHFTRHLRRTQKHYLERREVLRSNLEKYIPSLELQGFDAGMHLCAWLTDGQDDKRISRLASEHGLEVMPISAYSPTPLARGGFLLGYAAVPPKALEEAVQTLASIISEPQ